MKRRRLTMEAPQSNMGVALNYFYTQDHQVWVRGGGPAPDYPDITLCDYIRYLVREHNLDIDLGSDEQMGDVLLAYLMDGPETVDGLIALLYTVGWAFAELRDRLVAYEDADPDLDLEGTPDD